MRIPTSKKLITACLTNDEICRDNLERLSKALIYITKVYYGLNPDNRLDDVYRLAIQTICEKHPTLKFTELNLAYSERTIEKRQGVALTKDEIMQPIEDMIHKKQNILSIAEKHKQEFEEAQKSKREADEFKKGAMQSYIDSLGTGEFQGTLFEAGAIMECFSDLFTDQEKIDMNKLAIEDYKKAVMDFGTDRCMFKGKMIAEVPKGFGYYRNEKPKRDWHYFLALRVVNAALNRGINGNGYLLIQD